MSSYLRTGDVFVFALLVSMHFPQVSRAPTSRLTPRGEFLARRGAAAWIMISVVAFQLNSHRHVILVSYVAYIGIYWHILIIFS